MTDRPKFKPKGGWGRAWMAYAKRLEIKNQALTEKVELAKQLHKSDQQRYEQENQALTEKVEELRLAYVWLSDNTVIEDRGTKAQDSLERHERILKLYQEAG